MSNFLEIPIDRLAADVFDALLEEFASRDGTDYGEVETPLESRVSQLRRQLELGELILLYDSDNQEWDLLPKDRATEFLTEPY
ncbi:MAG: YheU family protein [Halioglobus sp.]